MSYLVRVAALELGARGSHGQHGGCPVPIDSCRDLHRPAPTTEYKQSLIDMTPIGRLGTPQDAAAITAFLASDDAGLIDRVEQIVADERNAPGEKRTTQATMHAVQAQEAWQPRL